MRSLFLADSGQFLAGDSLGRRALDSVGHMLNQDAWILSRHPGLHNLAQQWTERFETQGPDAAQDFLERRKRSLSH